MNLGDVNVKNFGKQLSMHIAASNPLALDQESIDQSIIDKEQELVTDELNNSYAIYFNSFDDIERR